MSVQFAEDLPLLNKALRLADFVGSERWDTREAEHSYVDDFSQDYFAHTDKENGILVTLNTQTRKFRRLGSIA